MKKNVVKMMINKLTAYMLIKYTYTKKRLFFHSRFGDLLFILDILKMSFFQKWLTDSKEF